MADATTSLLLKQISAAHDQVGSAIQVTISPFPHPKPPLPNNPSSSPRVFSARLLYDHRVDPPDSLHRYVYKSGVSPWSPFLSSPKRVATLRHTFIFTIVHCAQRLGAFGGSPGELTALDLEARTAWLGYTAELEVCGVPVLPDPFRLFFPPVCQRSDGDRFPSDPITPLWAACRHRIGHTPAVSQAAERQLALGNVERGTFLDAFKDKLATLRDQSAGFNVELRRARRAAKSNVKAAARTELLSGEDRAAANAKVARPACPRVVSQIPDPTWCLRFVFARRVDVAWRH